MELRTKLFSCDDISHDGRIFPKDVMEKAIKDFNENKEVGWITKENNEGYPSLNDTIGTLKKVTIEENGEVFGDVQLLPTPEGEFVKNMIETDNIHISPVGYGEVDENGVVKNIDITHFNIKFS